MAPCPELVIFPSAAIVLLMKCFPSLASPAYSSSLRSIQGPTGPGWFAPAPSKPVYLDRLPYCPAALSAHHLNVSPSISTVAPLFNHGTSEIWVKPIFAFPNLFSPFVNKARSLFADTVTKQISGFHCAQTRSTGRLECGMAQRET